MSATTAPPAGEPDSPERSWQIQGRRLTLPVRVRQASAAFALYALPTAAVRRWLTHPALQVPELVPGHTLGALACLDYVESDLGAYHEIALAFFAQLRGGRAPRAAWLPLGLALGRAEPYIHQLPVDGALSCEAGVRIWGFPKSLGEIRLEEAPSRRRCSWRRDGQLVLRLELPRGGHLRLPPVRRTALVCPGGALARVPVVVRAAGVGLRPGGARLELGEHPVAGELRSLGLPRRALLSGWVGRLAAEFGAAEALPRAGAAP